MSGARTVTVQVDEWVIGDHGDPPVLGRVEQYFLVFVEYGDEHRDDPGIASWDVVADPQHGGAPQQVPAFDGDTLVDRYDVVLHGPGWSAGWRSPRPVAPGPLRVRGLLVVQWPAAPFPTARVRGRVRRLRLVTESLAVPGGDPHENRPLSSDRRARVVPDCRDLFTDPPDPVPPPNRATRTMGVLVDLEPDRAGPVLPGAIAAHDDVLWIADRDGPTVLRVRAPGSPAPQLTTVTWDGPRLAPRGRDRQLHADAEGCWITDSTGTRRVDADTDGHDGAVSAAGGVRLLDRVAPRLPANGSVTFPLLSAVRGDTLAVIVHDPEGRQPAVLRLSTRGGAVGSVVLPARVVHAVVAHGEGFLVLLAEQGRGVSGYGGLRLAAVDLDGRLATGAILGVGGLRACPLSGPEPTYIHGNHGSGDRLFRVRPDGVSLDTGNDLPGPITGAWTVAGRLFVAGPARDLPDLTEEPDDAAAASEAESGGPAWALVELDPATLTMLRRAGLPRVEHPPAVTADGAVWVCADGVRALPGPHGGRSRPDGGGVVLDLEALALRARGSAPPRPAATTPPRSRHLGVERIVGRPEELPVPIPWSAVLGRGDGLVVALVGARVHRSGIELAVTIRSHYRRALLPTGAPLSDGTRDALLLGAEFADGRATTSHAHRTPGRNVPERDDQLVLHQRGGGGDGHHVDTTYFLSPLPPPGELTLHCLWLAHGVAETATTLDAELALAAADRVEILWPRDDPGPAPDDPAVPAPAPRATRRPGWPHPTPEAPVGGWFDRHFGAHP